MRLGSQLDSLRPLSKFLARALWNEHMTPAGYIPCFQPLCIACAGGGMLATACGRGRADPWACFSAEYLCNPGKHAWATLCQPTEASRPSRRAVRTSASARAHAREKNGRTPVPNCQRTVSAAVLVAALRRCVHTPSCVAVSVWGAGTMCARQASFSKLFLCLCRARCGSAYTSAARWRVCGRERTRLRESWEACSAAPARSNFSWLAHAAHARRARPLTPPSLPEPQRDALRLPFDHCLQGGRGGELAPRPPPATEDLAPAPPLRYASRARAASR